MRTETKCSECGAAIPADALDGHCSQCLFSLGLDWPASDAPGPGPPDLAPLLARSTAGIGVKFHYFGDYELLEEIARGGMGVVFRARQISLNRPVALKLITAGRLASEEAVKRFHLEAEAAARLDHPNIVPIYEIGEHEGHHYLSMKLVEGCSLARRLRNDGGRPGDGHWTGNISPLPREAGSSGARPEGVALSLRASAVLLAAVARAVHYAHQRGILHRDLKPGNILIDERGAPHVTDFGVAKLIEDDSDLTFSGAVVGTPSYMSPEQAQGKTKQQTTASDLWSLGALLYELVTGQPAFRAATAVETLRQVLEQEPRRPGVLNPAVDRDLETIVLKCLEKKPTRRYASAAALADELDRWLRHAPILARRTGPVERVMKWGRRQPVLAAAVGLLHLVLMLGLTGILWQWRQAVVARGAESTERQRAVSAEADASARLYESKLNYVRANRRSGQPGQRFDTLAELAQLAAKSNRLDLRNEAIACLTLPDLRPIKQWARDPVRESFVFDSRLSRYATNDTSGYLTIRDVETDKSLLHVLIQPAQPVAPSVFFSLDGRMVATIDEAAQVRWWDLPTKTMRSIDFPDGVKLFGFAPDSRSLVVKHPDGSLHFLNAMSGVDEKSLPVPADLSSGELQFGPSGEKFLTRTDEGIVVRRLPDGAHLRTLKLPEGAVSLCGAAWHPDGRRIAIAWLNTIGIWDVETGRQLAVFVAHETWIVGLTFTHNGDYLASASWDSNTRFWRTDSWREVLNLAESGYSLSIGADDRTLSLITFDGTQAKLYELPDLAFAQHIVLPPPQRSFVHHSFQCEFLADGELILAPDYDGIYVFHSATLAPLALVPVMETEQVSVAADGTSILTGGDQGAQRWPIRWSADRSELHLGPPTVLEPTRGLPVFAIGQSDDGRRLVAHTQTSIIAFGTNPSSEGIRSTANIDVGTVADVSPDGTWIATIPQSRKSLQILDGLTASLVTNLPTRKVWHAWFSPNGRWLAYSQDDSTCVVATADWSLLRRFEHTSQDIVCRSAFSPDGRILAFFVSNQEVRLVKFETGEELATLPKSRMATGLWFSPKGDRLAIVHEPGYLHLWDLRRLREHLASLELDWNLPPYPPAPPAIKSPPPRVVIHPSVAVDASAPGGE